MIQRDYKVSSQIQTVEKPLGNEQGQDKCLYWFINDELYVENLKYGADRCGPHSFYGVINQDCRPVTGEIVDL